MNDKMQIHIIIPRCATRLPLCALLEDASSGSAARRRQALRPDILGQHRRATTNDYTCMKVLRISADLRSFPEPPVDLLPVYLGISQRSGRYLRYTVSGGLQTCGYLLRCKQRQIQSPDVFCVSMALVGLCSVIPAASHMRTAVAKDRRHPRRHLRNPEDVASRCHEQ